MKKLFILIVTVFFINGLNKAVAADTMNVMKSGTAAVKSPAANTDIPTVQDIDGNYYTIVTIGNQTWMGEDLRTTKLNDGTPIVNSGAGAGFFTQAEWVALKTPARCWEGHESGPEPLDREMLYNFYAVASGKLAPEGWRVPTAYDWDTLAATVPQALALKLLAVGVGAGTNELGFNAPWAGGRFDWSLDYRPGGESAFWTSTNFTDDNALSVWIRQTGITPGSTTPKYSGMPVRLIKGQSTTDVKAISTLPNRTFTLNPNPVVNDIQINYESSNSGQLQLEIVDFQGRLQIKEYINIQSGANSKNISVANLQKGIYICRILNANKSESVKFIKN
jgi:uncharacterized protein (TIGR02145 family)